MYTVAQSKFKREKNPHKGKQNRVILCLLSIKSSPITKYLFSLFSEGNFPKWKIMGDHLVTCETECCVQGLGLVRWFVWSGDGY